MSVRIALTWVEIILIILVSQIEFHSWGAEYLCISFWFDAKHQIQQKVCAIEEIVEKNIQAAAYNGAHTVCFHETVLKLVSVLHLSTISSTAKCFCWIKYFSSNQKEMHILHLSCETQSEGIIKIISAQVRAIQTDNMHLFFIWREMLNSTKILLNATAYIL